MLQIVGPRIPGVQTTLNISYLLTFNKRWEPPLRTGPSQSNKAHPLMSAAAPAGNDTIHSAYQMAKLSQRAFEAAFVLLFKVMHSKAAGQSWEKQTLLSSTKSRRNALVLLAVCLFCCFRTSPQLSNSAYCSVITPQKVFEFCFCLFDFPSSESIWVILETKAVMFRDSENRSALFITAAQTSAEHCRCVWGCRYLGFFFSPNGETWAENEAQDVPDASRKICGWEITSTALRSRWDDNNDSLERFEQPAAFSF